MPAAKVKTQGLVISIGTTAATASTDTYTEIEGCKMAGGSPGITWSELDGTELKDTYKQSLKSLADAGTIELMGNLNVDPATGLATGQAALKTAAEDSSDPDIYNFKFVLANGRIWYVKARVFGFTRQMGSVSNLLEFRSQLRVTAALTEAAAA